MCASSAPYNDPLTSNGGMIIFAMKYLVSVILGFFSGVLLMVIGIRIATGLSRYGYHPAVISPGFMGLFMVGGWAVSTLLLVRLAEDAVRVIKRGSLLGAGEWLLFSFVWGFFDRQAPFQGRGFDDDGIRSMIFIGIMILICLATYAVARFMSPERSRERAPDLVIQMNQPVLKQCSRCGQLAESFARFCNSCGTPFVAGGLGEPNMSRE